MTRLLSILFASLFISSTLTAQEFDIHEMFGKMMKSIDNIKTVSFHLDKTERVKGKMAPGSQDVKLNVDPFKVYLKVQVPNKGAEVLYIAGQNDGKAKVNPNAFPILISSF